MFLSAGLGFLGLDGIDAMDAIMDEIPDSGILRFSASADIPSTGHTRSTKDHNDPLELVQDFICCAQCQ